MRYIHYSKIYRPMPNGQVEWSKGATYAPGKNARKRAERAAQVKAKAVRA